MTENATGGNCFRRTLKQVRQRGRRRRQNRRRTFGGTLRILASREQSWRLVSASCLLVAFEELHGPFMLFRRCAGLEGSEIPTLSCLGIFLPGIQAVFTRLKLSDHAGIFPLAGRLRFLAELSKRLFS